MFRLNGRDGVGLGGVPIGIVHLVGTTSVGMCALTYLMLRYYMLAPTMQYRKGVHCAWDQRSTRLYNVVRTSIIVTPQACDYFSDLLVWRPTSFPNHRVKQLFHVTTQIQCLSGQCSALCGTCASFMRK